MAGTIVVDRIESDASYASNINVASQITFSNTATFPAGTAALPSITTAGDPDTGIYFPSANTIGFTRGGIEVGKFDSNSANANFQFNSGYGSVATAYGCRAWVNFQGTGTVAIRGSGNVSSITDNGASDYTVNFTTAMVDTNYSVVSQSSNSGSGYMFNFPKNSSSGNITTSAVRGIGMDFNGTTEDHAYVMVAIFR